ncbi:MAG: hypothetical protein NC253_08555 [Ruminococcus sp.]|nr:hypothetical protein [Ruminococcus sp.]MCM1382182.1 hypothetical protein [Muribaculaceae bacterium]MCM1478963.1 hypothetical protein [Muribaculaceae bacterium]
MSLKISERHAEEVFSEMLAEGEEIVCTVICGVNTSYMRYDIRSLPFVSYASCTSGGRFLLAVFGADIFDEYSAKAFDISLIRKIKIREESLRKCIIKAELPIGNGYKKIRIETASKTFEKGFPNQEENLKKMFEILRKYENTKIDNWHIK